MFTNLLFLLLVLLIPEIASTPLIPSAALAFSLGLALFAATLLLIYLQSRVVKQSATFLINCELLTFLSFFHFVLGGSRLLGNSMFATTLLTLGLYFLGLFFFHSLKASRNEALREIQMLFPFALPCLVITLFAELLGAIALLLGLTLLLFFPPLLQWMWHCQPLPESPLVMRLHALCERAHFRHAGMRTWTVMTQHLNAAIIGILPRFRYVMFTEKLLNELSPESVEAVLAHEIGHSKRKHLILYPFILFGMLVCLGIFSELVSNPFVLYLSYALIIALYFRLVFGFFSRRFERQADLHIFEVGLPAEALIEALDTVAIKTGYSHNTPNWHHYSIQERIDFLKKAKQDPRVIAVHHFRVKRDFCLYLFFLGLAILGLTHHYNPGYN